MVMVIWLQLYYSLAYVIYSDATEARAIFVWPIAMVTVCTQVQQCPTSSMAVLKCNAMQCNAMCSAI